MDPEEQKALKVRRLTRLHLLKRLIEIISDGDFDNTKQLLNNLYNQNSSRRNYFSPLDRSSYNYGYMTIDEMNLGPSVW